MPNESLTKLSHETLMGLAEITEERIARETRNLARETRNLALYQGKLTAIEAGEIEFKRNASGVFGIVYKDDKLNREAESTSEYNGPMNFQAVSHPGSFVG